MQERGNIPVQGSEEPSGKQNNSLTQVNRMLEKAQQVARQYSLLQKEQHKCQEENRQLSLQCRTLIEQLKRMEQQIEILKMSKADLTTVEKKALHDRLTQYVKEIDRCISLLGE